MPFAEDMIRGDPEDKNNIFQLGHAQMNLPSNPSYDPSFPWVYKVKKDGTPAANLFFMLTPIEQQGVQRKRHGRQRERWPLLPATLELKTQPEREERLLG
jgi:hypothetical protein